MIGLILILAFMWLGYETDWMTVRLPRGLAKLPAQTIEYEYRTWQQLDPRNGHKLTKQYPFWLRFPEHMAPLCGWDYLENTPHIIPQYKIEIKAHGVTNKVTLKEADSKLLKDLATSILKPTKEQRKLIKASV